MRWERQRSLKVSEEMYRKHLVTVWENENFHFWPSDEARGRERKRERGRQWNRPWDGNCWNASPLCLAAAKLKLWPNVVAIIFIDFLYILTYFYLVWSAPTTGFHQRKEGSKTLLSIIIYYCFVASFELRRFVLSPFGIYFPSVWKNSKEESENTKRNARCGGGEWTNIEYERLPFEMIEWKLLLFPFDSIMPAAGKELNKSYKKDIYFYWYLISEKKKIKTEKK